MKLKSFIIPLLAMAVLGGCNNTPANSNSNGANVSVDLSNDLSGNNSSEEAWTPVETLASGSVSGSLIEIMVGEHLLVEDDYLCSFSPSDCENKKMTAVYDDSIISLKFQENVPTTFTISCKKKGHTVLKLYSEELDCLVFRSDIVVDEEIGLDKIENYLFNTRKGWKTNPEVAAMMGTYKMDFISNAPLTCVMTGSDFEEDNTRATLELTFKAYRRNNEFLFYVFDTTLDTDSSNTNKKFREMLVSVTGYSIYAYDNQGLINIFYKV